MRPNATSPPTVNDAMAVINALVAGLLPMRNDRRVWHPRHIAANANRAEAVPAAILLLISEPPIDDSLRPNV